MIEHSLHSKINRGFDSRPKAGNGTARPEGPPNATETVPPSLKIGRCPRRRCENLLKLARHARSPRRERGAQPPARNHNPHSTRRTA